MVAKYEASGSPERLPPSARIPEILPSTTPRGAAEDGYYNVPMLKPPTWRWHIALYFFFEGISAGSYLLATLADLFGKGRFRRLTRRGYYTSFLSFLPCPPLLIADLGRPARFLHMLRVFKPSSPMNVGSWALSAYSAPLSLLVVRQLIEDVSIAPRLFPRRSGQALLVPRQPFVLRMGLRLLEAMGIPFALTMASYPGVLLSTTSTPLWCKSRWLGALFSCSAIGTGAAATSLALALRSTDNDRAQAILEKIEQLAGVCEGVALVGYLTTSRETAKPLVKGRYRWHFWVGAVGVGLVLPTLLRARAAKQPKKRSTTSLLSSVCTLVGGLALKWAVTYAGRLSAQDGAATRAATRPSSNAPGWNPGSNALTIKVEDK